MGLKLEVGKYYKTRDGRKVGPMSMHPAGDCMRSEETPLDGLWNFDGSSYYPDMVDSPTLIALWQDAPTGPVRTVTRTTKEIVPGVYGAVSVHQITDSADAGHVWITLTSKEATPEQTFHALLKADQIRAAIATLTEIAQALEDQ